MSEFDPRALHQYWPAPRQRRPIVIFGAGSIVRDAHLPAYAKGGYEIAGIYDPDHEKAVALGYPAFGSLAEAASVEGAVFDLATPPKAHADILRALPEGSPVLIQKPMGMDLTGATEILMVCRDRKLQAAVNFQLRFAPMMLALRDAIDGGWLGEIVDLEVHGVMATPWSLWQFLKGLPRIEITMHSIHYLDCIRMLLGDPSGIHAKTIGHPAHQMPQTRTSAILDFGERQRCTLSVNHDWDYGRPHQACEIRVAGTEGAAFLQLGVNLDYPKGEPDILQIKPKGGDWTEVPLTGAWFPDAFTSRMHNLQRAAAGEEDLISPVEDGWKTMALVEAAYASSARPATPIERLP